MRSVFARLLGRLDEVRVFASPQRRRRFVVHVVLLALAFLAAGLLVRRHVAFLTDAAALREFVGAFGPWAPLALVVVQALQVVVAPVPGQVLAVVAGYLFGAWWGTLYNVIGITIGSAVAFWLARRYGRAYVERTVHPDALAAFDGIDGRYARIALFVFFLVPGLPDDVLCFAGGLTRIPLWQLVVIAVAGRAPAFFLVNVVGDLLGTNRPGAATVLAAVLVALSALGYRYRDRLVALFSRDG